MNYAHKINNILQPAKFASLSQTKPTPNPLPTYGEGAKIDGKYSQK